MTSASREIQQSADPSQGTSASPSVSAPATVSPAAPAPAGQGPPAPAAPAAAALGELLQGNRRFVEGRPEHGHNVSAAAAASGGQAPRAVVLGCIDSRVPLEAIFDQTFGHICVVRSGGHVLDRAVEGSVEFAVTALNVPLVMVLGHERCGAVAATVEALRHGQRPAGATGYLVDEIAPAVAEVGLDGPDVPARAMRAHVARTVRSLRALDAVAEAIAAGRVDIVGAVYDLDTGRVVLRP